MDREAASFLVNNVNEDIRLIFIGDASSRAAVLYNMFVMGFPVENALKLGWLNAKAPEDVYFTRNGSENFQFDADRVIAGFTSELNDSMKKGFQGMRVAGQIDWIRTFNINLNDVIDYESRINTLFASPNITAICQYQINTDADSYLPGILGSHPAVMINNKRLDNTFYQPPVSAKCGYKYKFDKNSPRITDCLDVLKSQQLSKH